MVGRSTGSLGLTGTYGGRGNKPTSQGRSTCTTTSRSPPDIRSPNATTSCSRRHLGLVNGPVFANSARDTDYGKEIWALYESGALKPETPLTGTYEADDRAADLEAVMREIGDARLEETARIARMQESGGA